MDVVEAKARQCERSYSDRDRKRLGAHYTPDAVIDYIVKRVLQAFVDHPEGLRNCLFGVDIDERAVSAAKTHLLQKASLGESDSAILDKNILVGDALSFAHPSTLIPMYNHTTNELSPGGNFSKHSFDCVIGNPPYVRIQNTSSEKRGCYTSSYTTASGRFDVSTLFIELSEYLLKENGRFGFIVSNKVLSTAGAKGLRKFLLTQFNLEEIVDLVDTKLFAAAVLPMILIASRRGKNGERVCATSRIVYSSITESHEVIASALPTDNILRLLDNSEIPFEVNVSFADRIFRLQRFYADTPSSRVKVWTFHNERENRILSKIRQNSICALSDIAETISVGLKTTADEVFIKPMTEDFIRQKGLETTSVYPVLESHNINRWTYNWASQRDLFVLYPHIEQNGKVIPVELEAYPYVREYLEANCHRLASRNYLIESGRRWYEIWVHQSPSDFSRRKIVTPDISTGNRFALDDKGFFVNGTCFYLILTDESDVSYYSILGLLNSKVIEYFHKVANGNSLYAKRFRYWSSYIGAYPVAERLLNSSDIRLLIAKNVGRLLVADKNDERLELEEKNNRLCYELFNLTEDEGKEIEATLSARSLPSSKKGNMGQ